MKVYHKVSIFSRAHYVSTTGLCSMKEEEIKGAGGDSVLENFTITLERKNMLIHLRQSDNNIKIIWKKVPGRVGWIFF